MVSGEMVTARRGSIAFFDAANPQDAVVVAVWAVGSAPLWQLVSRTAFSPSRTQRSAEFRYVAVPPLILQVPCVAAKKVREE
jgi:hypothetical protein